MLRKKQKKPLRRATFWVPHDHSSKYSPGGCQPLINTFPHKIFQNLTGLHTSYLICKAQKFRAMNVSGALGKKTRQIRLFGRPQTIALLLPLQEFIVRKRIVSQIFLIPFCSYPHTHSSFYFNLSPEKNGC